MLDCFIFFKCKSKNIIDKKYYNLPRALNTIVERLTAHKNDKITNSNQMLNCFIQTMRIGEKKIAIRIYVLCFRKLLDISMSSLNFCFLTKLQIFCFLFWLANNLFEMEEVFHRQEFYKKNKLKSVKIHRRKITKLCGTITGENLDHFEYNCCATLSKHQ